MSTAQTAQPTAEQEQIVQPEQVISKFMGMVTQSEQGVAREPGLVLTKEDIINIKLYVRDGLALPTEAAEVGSYIGYQHAGIAGLEPSDIRAMFERIRTNTLGWDDVEQSVIRQGIDLEIFAKRIIINGDDLISIINQMPLVERILKKVGATKLQDLSQTQTPKIFYDSDDQLIADDLKTTLDSIKKDIAQQKDRTTAVKTKVTNFRQEISQQLEPEVKRKRDLIKSNNLDQAIKTLAERVDDLTKEIEDKRKEYNKYVGLAFTGAAGGPVGLAITGGIFGDKAEKARKAKNRLIDEKRDVEKDLQGKQDLKLAIEKLGDKFADIDMRLIDAEQALQHLEFVWQTLESQIDASLTQFGQITDSQNLRQFVTTFKTVIDPWRVVQGTSTQLIAILDEAIEAYRQQYAS
ncbi:MAG: alpha-xenorhabdolysin family binary toxin subunit A [Caldilineaceae bacterium]|nr:alpha-xenorhabdolysin family binary toxin subunit A [Caldilineaceae bacterium]MCB0095563.1 alpha-xenorhabdolysin family binary toxin subunit A [Caldilineaceae bacterium]MCB0142631.1 alpha-xenorhabdolysin family binary toxin subunit A [Caldilineaceae bacterium]